MDFIAFLNVIKRWGDKNVLNIPQSPLFKRSCDTDNYTIIYISKKVLGERVGGVHTPIIYQVAPYSNPNSVDWLWWANGVRLAGKIEINSISSISQKEKMMINILIHEFGHVLGLPHLHPEQTDLMQSLGYGCEPDKHICNFTDADWEYFLEPYNPQYATLKYQRQVKLKRSKISNKML